MTLFPDAARAVKQAAGEPPLWEQDIAARREEARAAALAVPGEDVAEVHEVDADGVPCRLYVPDRARPGVILHAHGGGFVFNDVEVHDAAARRLANRTGLRVLSVDYRRPPEHRFPAAPDDVVRALDWLTADAVLGAMPVHLHGDSAGANLVLVAALRRPEQVAALVLIYPFLDPTQSFEAYRTAADGFDPAAAAWYWEQYAADEADLRNPELAPLRASAPAMAALPPTLVVTAEHDPLRDEGEALAQRLADLDVLVVSSRYQGQVHGFWRHAEVFPAAETVLGQTAGFLRAHARS